jgi:perosamine synthetase
LTPINKPIYDYREMQAVNEVFESGNFTVSAHSQEGGEQVQKFEKKLKEVTGAKYAIAVSSGTAALEVSLLALKIGKGDNVIVPSLTFVATANAVLSVGATPIFCDVDKHGQLDFAEAEMICKKHNINAIIIVDLYGRISNDITHFKSLCPLIIEDACQALGTPTAGRNGTLGCFSFYASKIITTMGVGGAIVTDSPVLDSYCKIMRNQGITQGECRFAGRNLLLPEANAAFGSVQLDRLESFVGIRRANLRKLGLAADSNGYMAVIQCSQRDSMKKMLNDAGIGAATYYDKPIHTQQLYSYPSYDLPMTDMFAETVINLPVHPEVIDADIHTMVYALEKFADEIYK